MQNRAYPGGHSEQDPLTGRAGLLLHKIVGEIMNVLWEIPDALARGRLLGGRRENIEGSIGRWLDISIYFHDSEYCLGHINVDLSEYPAYTAGELYIF